MPTNQNEQQAARTQARIAREQNAQRKAQANVQQTAGEIRKGVAGLSPSVAGTLGTPLDPSKGFDFSPKSDRPAGLPTPGEAPGGAEQYSPNPGMFATMGDMMAAEAAGGLPDDHDALLGGEAGPSGPVPPGNPSRGPVRGSQTPQMAPGMPRVEHPILSALRQDVGLDLVHPKDVEIGGHRWTIQTLSPGELSRASAMADMTSMTVTERELVFEIAVAAQAIVAIDGVPAYQVFGIDLAPGVIITDHLRPPRKIRYMAAAACFDFILDNGKTALGHELHRAYEDQCDPTGAVKSYLTDKESKKVTFRCPEKDCNHELRIIPQVDPKSGNIRLPFCQWHGCSMLVASVEAESPSLPLA